METKDIIAKGKCCACELPLNVSAKVNVYPVNKVVTWSDPTWESYGPPNVRKAVTILCKVCGDLKRQPKFIVEFEGNEIIYHPVEIKKK